MKTHSFTLTLSLCLMAHPLMLMADVVGDGSTGGVAGASIAAGNGYTYDITEDLGVRSGDNLFHSFGEFNVGPGEHANFSGDNAVTNVVARISGGITSDISGQVTSTIASASLWLINPAGFVFSNGAVVDVDGTFHASTADFVSFADGARYHADLSRESTLTTAPISAFGFIGNTANGGVTFTSETAGAAGSGMSDGNLVITNSEVRIQNADVFAKGIGIEGGDIAIDTSLLVSQQGSITITGGEFDSVDSVILTTGAGSGVRIDTDTLTIAGVNRGSRIQSGGTTASGGDINIETGALLLSGDALLTSASGNDFGGGNVTVDAVSVRVEDNSSIELSAGASSVAGLLRITASSDIVVTDASSLTTQSEFADGTAGAIIVDTSGDFELSDNSSLNATSSVSGRGGSVDIEAVNIAILDASSIRTETSGADAAGEVVLSASADLVIEGSVVSATSSGSGEGGQVDLRGNQVNIKGSALNGVATGAGTGGAINIVAPGIDIGEASVIDVSAASTATAANAAGNAGKIALVGDDVMIDGATSIRLNSQGGGDGGTLDIVGKIVSLQGVVVEAASESTGEGGDVLIRADDLHVGSGTIVTVTARGQGDAGILTLGGPTSNSVTIDGGAKFLLRSLASGNGGELSMTSSTITLNNAELLAESTGFGLGGRITLAGEIVSLAGTDLKVNAFASGDAGEVAISGNDVRLNGTNIELNTVGAGNGGQLTIAGQIISINAGTLEAGAEGEGEGGIITLTGGSIGIENNSFISLATLGAGAGGTLVVNGNSILMKDSLLTAEVAGEGAGGDVRFAADAIVLDGVSVVATTRGSGSGGLVELKSAGAVQLINGSAVNVTGAQGSTGAGGDIVIQADSLLLQSIKEGVGIGTGGLFADAQGSGAGGNVEVTASQWVIDGASVTSGTAGEGKGGLIHFTGNELQMNGGHLNAQSSGAGNGGDIELQATAVLLTDNADLGAQASGTGSGGNILVTAAAFSLTNGAHLQVNSAGAGNGGNAIVRAPVIDISAASISASAGGTGNAGFVYLTDGNVTGSSITVASASVLDSASDGAGLGGEIVLQSELVRITDSTVTVEATGSGRGGDLLIDSSIVLEPDGKFRPTDPSAPSRVSAVVLDGATITASAFGTGDAGSVVVIGDNLLMTNQSLISSTTRGEGEGGTIQLALRSVNVAANSGLTVSASGQGDGGVINIGGTQLTVNDSFISSNANGSGSGGEVNVAATNVDLQNNTFVTSSVSGSGSGGIVRLGLPASANSTPPDSVQIRTGSVVAAVAFENSTGDSGLININARDVLVDGEGSRLVVNTFSAGDAGTITITADSLTIQNSAAVRADTRGTGDGGEILLNVKDILLQSDGLISSETGGSFVVVSNAVDGSASAVTTGDAGNVDVLGADSLVLTDGGQILLQTRTNGAGGVLTVAGAGRVDISSGGLVTASADSNGDAGSIDLAAGEISVTSGGTIISSTRGGGAGGSVTLAALDVGIVGGNIIASAEGQGNAGYIFVGSPGSSTSVLTIEGGAVIESETNGIGEGGELVLVADTVSIKDAFLTVEARGPGTGGDIFIGSDVVIVSNGFEGRVGEGTVMLDGAFITASAFDVGNAGFVQVRGAEITLMGGTTITSSAIGNGNAGAVTLDGGEIMLANANLKSDTSGAGLGGDVDLTAENLTLRQQAVISTSSTGVADGGSVSLTVADTLQILNAQINTRSEQAGGGNVEISTRKNIRINESVITATANGQLLESDGGNIFVDPELFTMRRSEISANAVVGAGGNITLVADNFIVDTESSITATSQKGIDGTVEIESPNQAVNPVAETLPSGFQDLPEFLSSDCTAPVLQNRSYLVIDNLKPVRSDPADYLKTGERQDGLAIGPGQMPYYVAVLGCEYW